MKDIYFEPLYGKIYESMEDGKAVSYEYDGAEGRVSHLFIQRKIPGVEEHYCDIVTPYGYGGPVMEEIRTSAEELEKAFEKDFSEYCRENRIVSEFIRFHPIIGNGNDFKTIYHTEAVRHTVGTDLASYEDPVASEFGKQCRKNIRKALNNGVDYRITPSPECLGAFKDIYYSTMERNDASEFYFFDDKYFEDCLKYFRDHILFVEAIFEGRTIAAGMYFTYGDIIHIHLSGTFSEYLYLSPAYVLRYAVTVWGKENGYRLIHHGGGRSNDENDSLYKFKKQFGKNTEFEFCTGKRIWNEEVYKELCEKLGTDPNSSFFPAYRKAAI